MLFDLNHRKGGVVMRNNEITKRDPELSDEFEVIDLEEKLDFGLTCTNCCCPTNFYCDGTISVEVTFSF